MFRFKQFVIKQHQCAMKVSTDGILFGSWCRPDAPGKILDIGTGTGLLSLMLAQKTPTETQITALEIEPGAAAQAQQNVLASPWSERIQVINRSIQDYGAQTDKEFELIISNPPWFEYSPGAAHNQQNQIRLLSRTLARQQTGLCLSQLLEIAEQLLSDNGELYLLLPASAQTDLLSSITTTQLQLLECCDVHATANHSAHCQMWRFSKGVSPVTKSHGMLVIKDAQQTYSEKFRQVCKDYYLNF